MNINRIESGFNTSIILSDIKIYGVQTQPKLVSINGVLDENFIFDDVYNVSNFLDSIFKDYIKNAPKKYKNRLKKFKPPPKKYKYAPNT